MKSCVLPWIFVHLSFTIARRSISKLTDVIGHRRYFRNICTLVLQSNVCIFVYNCFGVLGCITGTIDMKIVIPATIRPEYDNWYKAQQSIVILVWQNLELTPLTNRSPSVFIHKIQSPFCQNSNILSGQTHWWSIVTLPARGKLSYSFNLNLCILLIIFYNIFRRIIVF